jgi:hypothetical protein
VTPRVKALIKHYKRINRLKRKIKPDTAKGKSGCRLWKGATRSDEWGFYEYAIARSGGKRYAVHRVMWEEKYGPLNGRVLRNTCGNTLCVAPDHWQAVRHWHEKVEG